MNKTNDIHILVNENSIKTDLMKHLSFIEKVKMILAIIFRNDIVLSGNIKYVRHTESL